jgi:serine/threonine protein kinase
MQLSDQALARLQHIAGFPEFGDARYTLVEEIGRGGMGTVFLAEDSGLMRQVALKVLRDLCPSEEARSRLQAEARILAGLEHPSIVPVHDVGTLPDGRLFYTMKLVRGRRLDQLAGQSLPTGEILRIFLRICEAAAFAHSHGVIHRDLKPENIMTGPFGEVLVMDWGVAKILGRSSSESTEASGAGMTAQGAVVGTEGYMAPEQARGDSASVGPHSDVWSLGIILQFLLRGEDSPGPLKSIWRKAAQQDPKDRYSSARELAADVERYLNGLPVEAHPENWLERVRRVARRHRVAILLILAYLLMRALLIFFTRR